MARKPAAKPAPAKPVREPITLPQAAAFTTDVRTLAVNISILLALLIVVPVIVMQFWRSQVVIQPIAVPDALVATGLTPEVAAGRLWDGLQAVKDDAGTAKQSVVSIPESAKVDFAIPDSGLSIDALVYYVRQFFNSYETRIAGEFRCADANCAPEGQSLRIRVVSNDVELIDLPPRGTKSEESYFRDAAAEVMARLDPFTALAAVATSDPARGKVLARRLIRSGHPDAKWAHNLLGNLLSNDGDMTGALAEYDAALAIDPDFPQALSNKGSVLLAQGDKEGARAAFERVLSRNRNDTYALAGQADLLLAEGKPDDAVMLLKRAAELRPLPPIYLNRAGSVMLGQNRMDEAEAFYKQALDMDPGDSMALATLALIYLNGERYEDAERVYRAAADFSPGNAEILNEHAGMLRTVHKFDEALERARRAIEIAPDVADYHVTAGKALQDLERYDEALAEIKEAERLTPDDPDVALALGDSYRLLDDKEAAIAAYNRYIALAPGDMLRPMAELYIKMLGGTPPATPAAPQPEPPAATASSQP